MRDPKRIHRVLETVRQVWERFPDLRLGQLLSASKGVAGPQDLFFVEDDAMEKNLREFELLHGSHQAAVCRHPSRDETGVCHTCGDV